MKYIISLLAMILAAKNIARIKLNIKSILVVIGLGLIMSFISAMVTSENGEISMTLRFVFGLIGIGINAVLISKEVAKYFASLCYCILSMILCILAESLTFQIYYKLRVTDAEQLVAYMDNWLNYLVFTCVLILIAYIMSFLLGKLLSKIDHLPLFNKLNKYNLVITTLLGSTFCIIYYFIMFGHTSTEVYNVALVVILIYLVTLMIITYILYSISLREERTKQQKIQVEQMVEYTTNLESLYIEMRKFRHDYVNILSSMIGYMEDDNMKGLKNHFYHNILPFSEQIKKESFKLGLLSHIKIKELKGIVSSKLIRAQEMGVDVFIDIAEPITHISMDIIVLCRIVGIIIDNAVEAALETAKPTLKIGFINKRNSVVIVVINSCQQEIPPVYKLYQKGFSTKGNNRGLGLYILKENIDKLENCFLDTVIKFDEFIQEFEINEAV